jgi:arylsulfatase A-like enzyme
MKQKITRRWFIKLLAAGTAATTLPACKPAYRRTEKPNFIIIFCDDLGYGDLACFGSKLHRTPNLDRMADRGTRFTSFYVTSSVCTPSRASLMTGCYPKRVDMHQDSHGKCVLFPVDAKGLNPNEITIAEILKEQGYATCCVGKWHLGDQSPFLPTRRGFDYYFGIPYSNDMGTRKETKNPPLPLMQNEKVASTTTSASLIATTWAPEKKRRIPRCRSCRTKRSSKPRPSRILSQNATLKKPSNS